MNVMDHLKRRQKCIPLHCTDESVYIHITHILYAHLGSWKRDTKCEIIMTKPATGAAATLIIHKV